MTITTVIYANQENRKRTDDGPCFHGRNGHGIQTGIEVWARQNGIVQLTPCSTRGLATGHVQIPKSDLDVVIAALQKIRDAQ